MRWTYIMVIIVAALVLSYAAWFMASGEKVGLEVSTPPTGSKSEGVVQVFANEYTCSVGSGITTGYCDVKGVISKVPTSGADRVILRTDASFASEASFSNLYDDSWIALDINRDGALEPYMQERYTSKLTANPESYFGVPVYKSDGTPLMIKGAHRVYYKESSNYIYVILDLGHYHQFNPNYDASIITSAVPVQPYASNGQEEYDVGGKVWTAKWNFCPGTNSGFKFCSGTSATTTETYDWSGRATSAALGERLAVGQKVTFYPTDSAGAPLKSTDFYITAQKWSLACLSTYDNKCDPQSGSVYCTPKENQCVAGYTYKTNEWCMAPTGSWESASLWPESCAKTPVGTKAGVQVWQYCVKPTDDYVSYKKCTSVNSNGCPVWSATDVGACAGSQKCYVGSSVVTGVGACKCEPAACTVGDRRTSQIGGDYDVCTTDSTGCTRWFAGYCKSDELTYDAATRKCLNQPSDPGCYPFTPYNKCVGDKVYHCTSNGITDEEGNQRWFLAVKDTCVSPTICTEDGASAYCACSCTVGSVKCITGNANAYELCKVGECWDDATIPAGMACYNDAILTKDVVPCENGGEMCESGKSCNTVTKACVEQGCFYDITKYPCTLAGQTCGQTMSDSVHFNKCYCGTNDATYCGEVIGNVKCVSDSVYKKCEQSSTTCPKWGVSISLPSTQICKSNVVQSKSEVACEQGGTLCAGQTTCKEKVCVEVGCQFTPNDAAYKCSTIVDKHNAVVESCTSNECLCKSDEYTATFTNFVNGDDRCYDNRVQKVTKYVGKSTCYRWEDVEDCGEQEVCYKNSPAVCKPIYTDVGILTKSVVGVGVPIGDVTIDVIGGVESTELQAVKVWIEEVSAPGTALTGTIKNSLTGSDGKVKFYYEYAYPRTGQLKIVCLVGVRQIRKEMLVEVKEAMRFSKLSCDPPIPLRTRNAECVWEVSNSRTGERMVIMPTLTLTQGGVSLYYESFDVSGKRGIKFTPQTMETVHLKLKAVKEGYIDLTQDLELDVQDLAITQTTLVDDADILTYQNKGVDKGFHQITLKFEESGEPVQVAYIDASMDKPSGSGSLSESDAVEFVESPKGSGVWKATYDFKQAGNTYELHVQAYLLDMTKDNPAPYSRVINTLASDTEDEDDIKSWIIVGVAVACIVLLAVLVAAVRRRR